ncbi:MAG: hypothetical protein AUH33_02765 [Chloroflexi bacterium 13_1_40CM_68_21]|nr:MAG: hypothetical protein AUH33_02765 [Chloroflexi bacterium 13_1_40CM_68_21]
MIVRDGTVDKLLADEIVAFFGAPYNEEGHERRAVEAGLEIISSFADLWGTESLVAGAVGTGIAFVGRVGHREVNDFTAVGQFVNQVTNAREQARPGELLVLPATYALVGTRYVDASARSITLNAGAETVGARVLRAGRREGRVSPPTTGRRELRTILFLDLVRSTEVATRIGDAAWRDLLARHYEEIRKLLLVRGGAEVDTAGDGLLATFSTPAEAIRFAHEIAAIDREIGLAARVGIHAGEVELDGSAIRGVAVVIAARIATLGDADEVLVSATVRELVAGSEIVFADRGVQTLKGLHDARQVFQALPTDESTPRSAS